MVDSKEVILKKAFTEVDDILEFTDKDIVNKIPKSFRTFIRENKDKNYISNVNPYYDLESQNLLEETRALINLIFSSYIANNDEKKVFNELRKK